MGKLPLHHIRVLNELDENTQPNGEWCIGFDALALHCGMDRQAVRRITRHLARKGYAEYWRGLWSDDGEPAGAGYCITRQGRELANSLTPIERAL